MVHPASGVVESNYQVSIVLFSSDCWLCFDRMVGRNDAAIAAALQAMAQAMQNNNNQNVGSPDKFQKNNPPVTPVVNYMSLINY